MGFYRLGNSTQRIEVSASPRESCVRGSSPMRHIPGFHACGTGMAQCKIRLFLGWVLVQPAWSLLLKKVPYVIRRILTGSVNWGAGPCSMYHRHKELECKPNRLMQIISIAFASVIAWSYSGWTKQFYWKANVGTQGSYIVVTMLPSTCSRQIDILLSPLLSHLYRMKLSPDMPAQNS